jgi:hypothetical protein
VCVYKKRLLQATMQDYSNSQQIMQSSLQNVQQKHDDLKTKWEDARRQKDINEQKIKKMEEKFAGMRMNKNN